HPPGDFDPRPGRLAAPRQVRPRPRRRHRPSGPRLHQRHPGQRAGRASRHPPPPPRRRPGHARPLDPDHGAREGVSAKAAAPAGVPVSLGDRIRNASTPARLRAFMYAIWGLAAILFLLGEASVSGAQRAMQTVGKDTAPSIIAAQEISSSLADLDANAGNYLLGSKLNQVAATQAFEQRRTQITKRLVDAAKNITYGEAESVPINTLFDGLGRYLEYAAEMRYQKDAGDADKAKGTYATATDLMHQRLLPAADALDDANYSFLKYEYARQELRSEGAEVVAGAVAALLVAVLVWAQIFLVRRMRRLFN